MAILQRGANIRLSREAKRQFKGAVEVHVKGLDDIMREFELVTMKLQKKEKRKMLRRAAKPLISAIKERTPVSDKPHKRLAGNREITYLPGNLKRSVKVLPFRKTNKVFVGPRVLKKETADTYGTGARVNAYYAHWVEFGTVKMPPRPYMRAGLMAATADVKAALEKEIKALLKTIAK